MVEVQAGLSSGRMSVSVQRAEVLAVRMLSMPEGMKVAVVRGRDGDGREFVSLSDPTIDPLYFPNEERMDIERMAVSDAYTSRDRRDGKRVVVPEYSDVIGYIRFPMELAKNTSERKMTPRNYSSLYERLVDDIVGNPERWITPI